MKGKRVLFLCVSFVLVALVSTSLSLRVGGFVASASGPLVTVHFIYVGQGDSILVDAQGVEVLIDGGPTSAGSIVLGYLSRLGVSHLSLMVATHMHEDHIGGLIAVLKSSIQVDEVLTNNESYTTQSYTQFIALAQTHTLIVAQRGQVYTLTSTVNMTVYNPMQPLEFTDQNENSIVLKLQAGETSFLLEGDASSGAEASMITAGLNLHSNLLKVGHHGSAYATTDAFLSSVQPTYAVISCGLNNQYGFPAPETLQRLSNHSVVTYGTYSSGTIIATSDGAIVTFLDNPVGIPEFASVLPPGIIMLATLLSIVVCRKRARHLRGARNLDARLTVRLGIKVLASYPELPRPRAPCQDYRFS
jgi:competence protein ComEC